MHKGRLMKLGVLTMALAVAMASFQVQEGAYTQAFADNCTENGFNVTSEMITSATAMSLSSKNITVVKGKYYTLSVYNLEDGAKVTWKSSKPKIASITASGNVKGIKAGSATIVCKVTKGITTHTYTCTVHVFNRTAVVSKQNTLNLALLNNDASAVKISTDKAVSFTVYGLDYTKRKLIIDAPNATVNNYGSFKSVNIVSCGKYVADGVALSNVTNRIFTATPTPTPVPAVCPDGFEVHEVKIPFQELNLDTSSFGFKFMTSFMKVMTQVETVSTSISQYMYFKTVKAGTASILIYDKRNEKKEAEITFTVQKDGSVSYEVKPYTAVSDAIKSGNFSGLSSDDEIKAAKKAKSVLDKIITDDMDDFEKVKAVHDWIIDNTSYAYDELNNDNISNVYHNCIGVFVYGKAVCDGYASAFRAMLNALDIDVKYINGLSMLSTGDYENHQWNIVKIDGEWYQIDCTYDDPVSFIDGVRYEVLNYKYFLLNDTEMKATGHIWDSQLYDTLCNGDKY